MREGRRASVAVTTGNCKVAGVESRSENKVIRHFVPATTKKWWRALGVRSDHVDTQGEHAIATRDDPKKRGRYKAMETLLFEKQPPKDEGELPAHAQTMRKR